MAECERLIVFSKRIDASGGGSEIECVDGCECDGEKHLTVVQRVRMKLHSHPCDQLGIEIPDGARFEAEIRHYLRVNGPCGGWLGYQDGTFQITGGAVELLDGRIRGTRGIDVRDGTGDLCCDYMHSEGILTARTASTEPKLDGCRLLANYRTEQEMGLGADPCDPLTWLYWGMTMSGLVVCDCK